MQKRAQNKIDNWQEFVQQIAAEIIHGIIVDTVKEHVRNYIIKKIGVRIVQGLNVAAAIYDLASGGTERMRMRNAIACILVALESNADEDMTIAAKVCARIIADAFEDKIMAAIVNAGKRAALKAGKHVAIKVREAGKTEPAQAKARAAADTKPAQTPAKPQAAASEKPADAHASGAHAKAAPAASAAPSPDNLSLGAGGPPDHRASVGKPAPKNPDEAAERAVADMKQKIRDDLRAKAAEAVRQSSASNGEAPRSDAAARNRAGKAAAAGTSDNGTRDAAASDRGVTHDARGTDAKISAAAASPATTPSVTAAAGGSSDLGGDGGGDSRGGGDGSGRRRRQYPPRPPRGPPPPDAGTLENPRPIPALPDPVLPNVGVKEDNTPPEDLQDVRTQLNPQTASRSDVDMQRAN